MRPSSLHLLIALLVSFLFAPVARADLLFALRSDNTLLAFDSGSPGVVTPISVSGLGADVSLQAIDFRPADGRLYAIGSDAAGANVRLYRIDHLTGVASAIGSAVPVSPASAMIGMDFDPVVDRLRVTNAARANFRMNPNDGTMLDGDSGIAGTQQDTPLSPAQTYYDAAYDRSVAGIGASTLFAINFSGDILVRVGGVDGIPSPNTGAATSVGVLGILQQPGVRGLDFVGPWLYLVARVAGVTNLYLVSPATGAASLLGAVGGNPVVVGLAGFGNMAFMAPTDAGGFDAAGSIAIGQREYFALGTPGGSRLWALVDAGGPRNDATASRDVSLRVYAPNFSTVLEEDRGDTANTGEDDTADGSGAGIIAGFPMTDGIHFLEVTEGFLTASNDDDPVSPFKLSATLSTGGVAEVEGNDTLATANSIGTESGVVVRTGTASTTDIDWFAVDAIAGDVLLVAADGNPTREFTLASELNIDSLRLLGPSPSNTILQSVFNRNTGTSPNQIGAGFAFYVMRSGRYYVTLEGGNSQDYALLVKTIRRVASIAETASENGSAATAQPLPPPTAFTRIVGGALSGPGDVDVYSFQALPNSRVWAYVDTGGPLNQTTGVSRDSTLTLTTNAGATLIESDDSDGTGNGGDDTDGSNGEASLIAGRLLSGGSYQLRVAEAGDDQPIDPYRLFVFVTRDERAELEPNNTPAQAQIAGSGNAKVISAVIGQLGDVDYYAIDAGRDDVVFIAADADTDRDGNGIDLALRLFAPDGSTQLINPAGGIDSSGASPMPAEGFSFRFIQAGRYYLSVQQRTDSATGAYRLMIEGAHLFADGFE